MAENVRPPVAIRIVRPYGSEDELLEHELDTVGKTSVVLIGAHPRPTGVILRFEVTLTSGATVLRGEGRVLAHKDNAFRGQPGLTLRFTRLDPRSKALVDRATALRDARQAEGGSPSRPAPRPDSPIAEALSASTPPPAPVSAGTPGPSASSAAQESAVAKARATAREKANATARANARRTGASIPPSGKSKAMALTPPPLPVAESPTPEPTPVTSIPGEVQPLEAAPPQLPAEPVAADPEPEPVAADPEPEPEPEPVAAATEPEPEPVAAAPEPAPPRRSTPAAAAKGDPSVPAPTTEASASPRSLEAPPDRADLLARLRDRAGKLAPERVQEILDAKP